ncbi:aminoglycoside phosphotransferase family protein [Variovorax sp. HJSM1_2]|uniref:aminoglycoside phosphotransferase family protein n=1 Tax=Variovorax sp. HJSM1_2 TaxID=3366263 RepID=UPI003BD0F76C
MSHTSSPVSPVSTPNSSTPAATSAAIEWADTQRQSAFNAWLTAVAPTQQLRPDTVRLASADASFRRYFRVDTVNGASRIIMDAPPDKENSEPFVRIAALMGQAGLRVPEVLSWDAPQGFMLLTDLGSDTMMARIDAQNPTANQPMYLQAVDSLLRLQQASKPGVLPEYNQALLQRELSLFPDWYLTQHRGVVLDNDMLNTLSTVFEKLVAHNLAAPQVYVHRDFMPRNLMAGTAEHPELGVLDFQDAVYGPITYDIASLMRDAFLTWDEDFVLDITVRYWQQAKKLGLVGAASASGWGDDFGAFYQGVEWMGLQRHLKVAGIFARLTLRDGKPKYLADTPRFIHYIRSTAGRYRDLIPLMRLVDKIEGTTPVTGFAYGRM